MRSVFVSFLALSCVVGLSSPVRADEPPSTPEPPASPESPASPETAPTTTAIPTPVATEATPSATPGTEEPPRRYLFGELALGVGAPVGFLGVSLVVIPIRFVAVYAGAGFGTQSVNYSLGARGRVPLSSTGRSYLGIGAGWSSGEIAIADRGVVGGYSGHPPTWWWRSADLVNVDLSYEHHFGILILRPFLGAGAVANDDYVLSNARCPGCSPGFGARLIPYAGLAMLVGFL